MTENAITTSNQEALALASKLAAEHASKNVFEDYRSRKSDNTLIAHDDDLRRFCDFINTLGLSLSVEMLNSQPEVWQGIGHGLVEGFRNWLMQESYAVSTVNRSLSTVKKYAALAFKARQISHEEHALIRTVTGYTRKEGKKLDEKRVEAGIETRRLIDDQSQKKAQHISISSAEAKQLKTHDDTPQGRRDKVLMCLLLDHGLRCGEVAMLQVGNFNLKTGMMIFYRPKVDKEQTHRLTRDTLAALRAYFGENDAPLMNDDPLLRSSRKGGELTDAGMSERAITKRVKVLGERIGILGLSAHDCRHYWATSAAHAGTDAFRLQEAGGWSSLAMPRRYVEAAKIANEGVKLPQNIID